jgi:hypothetical protein
MEKIFLGFFGVILTALGVFAVVFLLPVAVVGGWFFDTLGRIAKALDVYLYHRRKRLDADRVHLTEIQPVQDCDLSSLRS